MPLDGHAHRAGFTLVELLVVIAIIALLVSIILPAFSNARSVAVQVKCMSHFRSTYAGFIGYVDENRGFYRPGYYDDPQFAAGDVRELWPYHIMRYLGGFHAAKSPTWFTSLPEVFACPGHGNADMNFNTGLGEGHLGSYVVNVYVSNYDRLLSGYKFPAEQFFLFDSYTVGHNFPSAVRERHSNGANYLLMDGHVDHRNDANNSIMRGWRLLD